MAPTDPILISQAHVTNLEVESVVRALNGGWVAPLGPEVDCFEAEMSAFVGIEHALALSSGTAALHLGLLGLGVKPNDDVIVPTLTFAATAFAVSYVGANPIFLDVDRQSWGLDPEILETFLSSRAHDGRPVAAIIPVDVFGRPADYGRILPVAARHGVPVLVDAAESLGAQHGDRATGTLGRAGIYSFNGNKIMTTSGGGMLVSDDEGIVSRARRWSAQSREDCPWYEHQEVGFNYRLSNVLAALGRAQLARLPAMVDRRRQIRTMYSEMFAGLEGVVVNGDPPWGTGNAWLSVVTFDRRVRRGAAAKVWEVLREQSIETRPTWKPMHQQPVFAGHESHLTGEADRVFEEGLCLPSGVGLTDGDVERVADCLKVALADAQPTKAVGWAGMRSALRKAGPELARADDREDDQGLSGLSGNLRGQAGGIAGSDPVPFAVPDVGEAEIEAVAQAMRSGWVTSGPEMAAFERDFAGYLGGQVETVAVNSATAGLHLALEACGIGPGDEVIIPTWTFTATAEVVRYVGATPVLVDVDPRTLNIDLLRVAEALTPATRAVIPVHFAGLGVDLLALRKVVGPGIRIIEDAAHALPTVKDDVLVGECRYSDAAVFSFYATKTITTGEGGMIATRNGEIAARARVMRLHGIDRDAFYRYRSTKPSWHYDVVAAGFKYNLTDPASAMGRVQLGRSDRMHARRQELAQAYFDGLEGLTVQLPARPTARDIHSWHLFILRLTPEAPVDRDGFIEAMAQEGVGTSVHFIPLHLHSFWRDSLGLQPQQFPSATEQADLVVSLPIFSAMTDGQMDRVVGAVKRILS